MKRESKRGFGSSTLIGRKDLRHEHIYGKWWWSPTVKDKVRMCACGDHQEEKELLRQYHRRVAHRKIEEIKKAQAAEATPQVKPTAIWSVDADQKRKERAPRTRRPRRRTKPAA
jgi:hypothetical protein